MKSFLEYYPAARRGDVLRSWAYGFLAIYVAAFMVYTPYGKPGIQLLFHTMLVSAPVIVYLPNLWLRFFFPIVGLDNVLTVVGDKVLKPGQVLKRWSYPSSVHTVPLEGAEYINWALNLSGASQLHDLELFVPAYRPDVSGEWSIKFFADVQYSIKPDHFNPRVLRQEDPSSLRAQLYQAIVANRLGEKLRETVVGQLHELLEKYCDSNPIQSDYEFSAALLNYVNDHWVTDFVYLHRNYPLFLSLKELQMELVYQPPEESTVI